MSFWNKKPEETQFLSTDHQLMPGHKKGGQPDAPLACAGQTETITGPGCSFSWQLTCSVDEFKDTLKLDGLFVSISFTYTGWIHLDVWLFSTNCWGSCSLYNSNLHFPHLCWNSLNLSHSGGSGWRHWPTRMDFLLCLEAFVRVSPAQDPSLRQIASGRFARERQQSVKRRTKTQHLLFFWFGLETNNKQNSQHFLVGETIIISANSANWT